MALAAPASRAERLNELSVSEIARRVGAGETTAEAVVRACLERIEAREPQVQAWAFLDPELAVEAARKLDRMPAKGALHGVPLGIKDVIDAAGMPTGMGSPIYDGFMPPVDAACVALTRRAGALVLGKTRTAEFAGSAPTVTRNPHNLAHTPGGSSSGSAASVADFMVPAAFGTQTGGSVLRPASFCGVIGFKPTFGTFNPVGMKPAAESFDTIGLIARSLDDIELLTQVLTNARSHSGMEFSTPPRVGVCRAYLWETAQPETVEAVAVAEAALGRQGATISALALPERFRSLAEQRAIINAYERAHGLAAEWDRDRAQFSESLDAICERGFAVTRERYIEAQRYAAQCRRDIAAVFDDVDVILAPTVSGEAPEGLSYAGDPRLQEVWTFLHVPAISLPTHTGPKGLPVGIQLIGPHYGEDRLFAATGWVLNRLGQA